MILALLVSLVCLESPFTPPWPVQVSVVRHSPEPDTDISSTDARCNLASCWPVHPGEHGCALTGACAGPVGYVNIAMFPDSIEWGLFKQSDAQGCVDADLLPVPPPESNWVFWFRAAP